MRSMVGRFLGTAVLIGGLISGVPSASATAAQTGPTGKVGPFPTLEACAEARAEDPIPKGPECFKFVDQQWWYDRWEGAVRERVGPFMTPTQFPDWPGCRAALAEDPAHTNTDCYSTGEPIRVWYDRWVYPSA